MKRKRKKGKNRSAEVEKYAIDYRETYVFDPIILSQRLIEKKRKREDSRNVVIAPAFPAEERHLPEILAIL